METLNSWIRLLFTRRKVILTTLFFFDKSKTMRLDLSLRKATCLLIFLVTTTLVSSATTSIISNMWFQKQTLQAQLASTRFQLFSYQVQYDNVLEAAYTVPVATTRPKNNQSPMEVAWQELIKKQNPDKEKRRDKINTHKNKTSIGFDTDNSELSRPLAH